MAGLKYDGASSAICRASSREGESFSAPSPSIICCCSGVAVAGTLSLNTRTASLSCPLSPGVVSPPTMSLFSTASSGHPSAFASCARCLDPYSPCSSPATATNTIVPVSFTPALGSPLSARADSIDTATPLASSLAPGDVSLSFITSVARES